MGHTIRADWFPSYGTEEPVSVSLAWRRYLASVREATAEDYDEAEASAWSRLSAELERIGQPLRG